MEQAMDVYEGPVLASHHNCRALVPGDRQLADEQIKKLISRGAVIGTALDAWMLYPNWIRGQTKPEVVGLEAVADHIDHVCQIAGNVDHAAIGSDLDGGFGTEQTPRDLEHHRRFAKTERNSSSSRLYRSRYRQDLPRQLASVFLLRTARSELTS